MPDQALEELLQLFEAAEASGTWPRQLLVVVGRLLGKKTGGERIIGILYMDTRVWGQARATEVQSWAADACEVRDAAIRGHSAVFEAFVRAVDKEAHAAL